MTEEEFYEIWVESFIKMCSDILHDRVDLNMKKSYFEQVKEEREEKKKMTKTQTLFWCEMKDKAIKMIKEGASFYEIKCAIIDSAIIHDVDNDYSIRELYIRITNVTVEAYKSVTICE